MLHSPVSPGCMSGIQGIPPCPGTRVHVVCMSKIIVVIHHIQNIDNIHAAMILICLICMIPVALMNNTMMHLLRCVRRLIQHLVVVGSLYHSLLLCCLMQVMLLHTTKYEQVFEVKQGPSSDSHALLTVNPPPRIYFYCNECVLARALEMPAFWCAKRLGVPQQTWPKTL